VPLVLDASVTLSWCFEDETSEYAEALLTTLPDEQAIAPDIWPLEVANALLVAECHVMTRPIWTWPFESVVHWLSLMPASWAHAGTRRWRSGNLDLLHVNSIGVIP
jgi:hypothetical protein